MGLSICTTFLLIILNTFTSTLGQSGKETYWTGGELPPYYNRETGAIEAPHHLFVGGDSEEPPVDYGGEAGGPPVDYDGEAGGPPVDYDGEAGGPPVDYDGEAGGLPVDYDGEATPGDYNKPGNHPIKNNGGDNGYEGQQSSDCDEPRNGMERTGIKSKYFFGKDAPMTYNDIQGFCQQQGLQMAEVGSETDINHLEIFAKSLDSGEHTYMLATKVNNGMFSNPSGSMSFQNFEPGFQFMPNVPCVIIRFGGTPIMEQTSCDTPTEVLCQFKSNDPCFTNSAQEESKFLDELIPTVGGLEGSHFVISSTQKSKEEADNFCKSQFATLLEIPSQKVNEYVWRIAKEYTSSLQIDPKTAFWTGGSVGSNNGVVWNKGGGSSGSANYNMVKGNQHGGDMSGHCVTVGAELPSQMKGMYVTTLRMQNCDIPHYFMCYYGELPEDDIAPSKESNDTETGPGGAESGVNTNTNAMTTPIPYEPPSLQGDKGDNPDAPGKEQGKEVDEVKEPVEEVKEEEEEFKSCYNITSLPPFELNYDTQMELDPVLTLAKWTRDNHIEELTATDFPYKPESEWRKSMVIVLSDIFKNVCSTGDYLIPREFIHTMSVMISLYYNSLKSEYTQAKATNQVWDELMAPLSLCVNSSTPLSLKGRGMYIDQWRMRESGQSTPILIPEELVDLEFWKNPVIEVLWNLFSLSVGYCMPRAETPINWAAEYFHNFDIDYLEPVKKIWISRKPYDFGVIIGDFDMETLIYNVRACTVAAYMENGVADRQLIRPLKISKDHSVNSMNEKTGNSVLSAT